MSSEKDIGRPVGPAVAQKSRTVFNVIEKEKNPTKFLSSVSSALRASGANVQDCSEAK